MSSGGFYPTFDCNNWTPGEERLQALIGDGEVVAVNPVARTLVLQSENGVRRNIVNAADMQSRLEVFRASDQLGWSRRAVVCSDSSVTMLYARTLSQRQWAKASCDLAWSLSRGNVSSEEKFSCRKPKSSLCAIKQ